MRIEDPSITTHTHQPHAGSLSRADAHAGHHTSDRHQRKTPHDRYVHCPEPRDDHNLLPYSDYLAKQNRRHALEDRAFFTTSQTPAQPSPAPEPGTPVPTEPASLGLPTLGDIPKPEPTTIDRTVELTERYTLERPFPSRLDLVV